MRQSILHAVAWLAAAGAVGGAAGAAPSERGRLDEPAPARARRQLLLRQRVVPGESRRDGEDAVAAGPGRIGDRTKGAAELPPEEPLSAALPPADGDLLLTSTATTSEATESDRALEARKGIAQAARAAATANDNKANNRESNQGSSKTKQPETDGASHAQKDKSDDAPATDDQAVAPATDDLNSIKEELEEEERIVREVGGYGAVLACGAMIFTAWQMSDNPDGLFATMCRLLITICGLVINILLAPCRRCIGHSSHASGRGGHVYGHVPGTPNSLEFGYS